MTNQNDPAVEALARRHIAVLVSPRQLSHRHGVCTSLIDRLNYRLNMYEVGYSWHRAGSHHFNGVVYDCVLGQDTTREKALLAATLRVERMERKVSAPRVPQEDGK